MPQKTVPPNPALPATPWRVARQQGSSRRPTSVAASRTSCEPTSSGACRARPPGRNSAAIFPASSALTTPSSRRSSTRSSLARTSSLLGLRARRRAASARAHGACSTPCPYVAGWRFRQPLPPHLEVMRATLAERRDPTPIAWNDPTIATSKSSLRLMSPVADLSGDLDPIKAARSAPTSRTSSRLHMACCRAQSGIFAVNELPDLAGKIQVALFNIMQEGDVQIKGYPVRWSSMCSVFSATRRTTPRAAKSSPRSRTAWARRSAPTIRRRSAKVSPSRDRNRGRSRPLSTECCQNYHLRDRRTDRLRRPRR